MKHNFLPLQNSIISEMLEDDFKNNSVEINIKENTSSTNEDAKLHIENQPEAISVHLSEQQIAGKGRNGKKWISPKGKNIYLSVGWKSDLNYSDLEGLSLAVGVIIAKILNRYTESKIGIKWPNDILIKGKKISGILIETLDLIDQKGIGVVIGIGINVHMSVKDGENIDQDWISLDEVSKKIHDRNKIVSQLVREIIELSRVFPKKGFKHYKSEFEEHNILKEKLCNIVTKDSNRSVKVKGVNDKGELIVQEKSEYLSLRYGEVSIREL
tara:strand:+ start:133 stop:942 length:810 start_codon:yes stop_codon:yes gene_type:complete